MKDISKSLQFFMRTIGETCPSRRDNICNDPNGCICAVRAEIWSYIDAVIPRDCQKLELSDFTGCPPGSVTPVLNATIVQKAKQKLIRYCWGKVDSEFNPKSVAALKKSIIKDRRAAGTSLVIHGQPFVQAKTGTTGEVSNISTKKIGRTLVASLIMKEVIKRRAFDGHGADTYEWVQFQTMKSRLMAKDMDAISDYQTCDWLVVDNIFIDRKGGENMRVFAQNMLDSVLMERIDQQLPTILVFQFDINTYLNDLQDHVGVGMAQIAFDENTFKISLTNSK